jgi:hypothetical protein
VFTEDDMVLEAQQAGLSELGGEGLDIASKPLRQ